MTHAAYFATAWFILLSLGCYALHYTRYRLKAPWLLVSAFFSALALVASLFVPGFAP